MEANDGRDLVLRRVALGVTPGQLSERSGIAPSTISRWENSRRLTPKARARYLAALATFGTIPTVTVTVDEDAPRAEVA